MFTQNFQKILGTNYIVSKNNLLIFKNFVVILFVIFLKCGILLI